MKAEVKPLLEELEQKYEESNKLAMDDTMSHRMKMFDHDVDNKISRAVERFFTTPQGMGAIAVAVAAAASAAIAAAALASTAEHAAPGKLLWCHVWCRV